MTNTATTTVQIKDFIRHFEFQLAKCLAIELGEINETISIMFFHLKDFRANECNTKLTNSSDSKTIKIAESIDSLLSQFGNYPPVLPHAEFIDEFNHKIRKKLRNIESSGNHAHSGSGKSANKGGNQSSSASSSSYTPLSPKAKTFLTTIMAEVDTLETLKSKQLITCQYLSEIKAAVHTPLQILLDKYAKLPSAPDEYNEVLIASQAVDTIEAQYKAMKSTPLLVKMVTLRLEAETVESKVLDLLAPLREAAAAISVPASAAQQRESVWSRSLLPLLACPTGELLARCCHKSIMENFASSVLELQAALKKPSDSEGSSFRRKQLFGEIEDKILLGVEQFDIELFAAHLDDWRVRVCEIEIQSNSPDFSKSYKDLVKARTNLKKAGEMYEKKMYAYSNSLASYSVVEKEMIDLKKKLEEVCVVELQANVEILLPQPQGTGLPQEQK
mmetsp:Transcript_20983/g.39063  ORF Transcript_20983/g.39063 Transcript_20983/m.39063 type:complete len:446 (-) Transcript_20983:151-1488(-)